MGGSWVPTIIAEVDRGAEPGTVENVSKALKVFCVSTKVIAADAEAARVIIVLSDANAAFSLPADEDRQKIIWVEDFSTVEANEYLNNAKFLLNKDGKRKELFNEIGTRVATLKQLVIEGEDNMDVYVADVIDGAKATLKKLLAVKFYKNDPKAINFKAIHEALLKNPKGVRVDSFDGATAIPDEVCVHLRKFHAFVYHYPSDQYRYAGKKYEKAAKGI